MNSSQALRRNHVLDSGLNALEFWPEPSGRGPDVHAAPVFPLDLSAVSTRDLTALCNQAYRLMDSDFPPPDACERYESLAEELDRRESAARMPEARSEAPRTVFRDNVLYSRFELYNNGLMAGYVKYEQRNGQVRIIQVVVDRRFRRWDLEPVLMKSVLLNAHRRRLDISPFCPESQEFFIQHPQFVALLMPHERRRFKPAAAGSAAEAPAPSKSRA